MGKITLMGRTPLLILFLFGSSLFLNIIANTNSADITINGTITDLACNNDTNAAISITVSGGTAPYSYLWNNNSTSPNRTNLSAGTYTLTVTDALLASTTATFEINQPTPIIFGAPSTSNVSCFNGNDGSITAGTVSGGSGDYTYSIDGINFKSTNSFNSLSTGNYTVTVKDSNGCIKNESVTIEQPSVLTMQTATTVAVTCNGVSDGSITAGTVSGGNNGYEYSIDNNNFQPGKTFSNLAGGDYTLTVRDAKGCTDSESLTIAEPLVLAMQASTTTAVTCNGVSDGSITAGSVSGGNNGYEYSIDGTNFQSTKTFQNLSGGDYTLTVRDAKGCTDTENLTIAEPSVLTMQAATTVAVTCNGVSDGSVTAGSVSGGNNGYEYSIDNNNFQPGKTFSNLAGGDYTLTVRDAKGCTDTENLTIAEPSVLTMQAATTTAVTCNGVSDGSITAGAVSGGNNGYEYSINGTNFQTGNTFSNIAGGDYTLTVRDNKGCTDTVNITVEEPSVLTMQAATTTAVTCNGVSDGSITAGAVSGGNNGYEYSINGTNFQSSNTFQNLAGGDYTLTVRDAKGCTDTENLTIAEPSVLTMQAATTVAVTCNGVSDGSITAGTVSGGNNGYEYSINGTNFQTGNTFSNLAGGDYILTVRDAKGCINTENLTIAEPIVLTMQTASVTNLSCYDAGDGKITAGTILGGNGGFEYSIDGTNFTANNTFTDLNAGLYTLTVRDVKGCSFSSDLEITGPQILLMEPATIKDISCNGASDGVVTVGAVTGGTKGYQYSIDGVNFGSSTTFQILYAGTYTVSVRDTNGCLVEEEININEPEPISFTSPTSTETTCFGSSDGTITSGIVTGGNGGYLYSIDNTNFNNTGHFTGVEAGNYTIFIKDSLGCATQSDVIVTSPDKLEASINVTNVSCFGGADGTITITNPLGGHGSYEYSLDGSTWQSAASFTSLSKGTYTVKIRDLEYSTCEVTLSTNTIITQPAAALAVQATTTRTLNYGTATGSATANGTGGTPGYTYEWRKAGQAAIIQNTKTATNLVAGIYKLTIIDSKGCKLEKDVEIIDAIEAFILTRSTCEIEDDIDAIRTFHYIVEDQTAVGGVAPYTYSWDFGVDAINQFRSGIGEFWVDYSTIGNKTITLTVTDSTGETYITTQDQYIGKCYNPCGRSSNIEFDPNNIYIGYTDGTRMETTSSDYCDSNVPKYIFIQVDKSANIYNPYIELSFIISNDITEVTNQYYVNGCRSGDDIDEDQTVNQPYRVGGFIKLALDPIIFDCGDNLNIDTFYTTWTNVSKKECGANNNKFCFSTNEPVFVPTDLRAQATPTPVLCKGESMGTITVKASGGFAPYGYKLTETATSQSQNLFINLPAGDYIIYVEDAAGLKTTTTATVLEPATAITATTGVTNPLCYGQTGTGTVTATGGTPFVSESGENYYTYLWNDASEQTTATATNLTDGEYTVTVIDKNGCQAIETITIVEPAQITLATAGEDQIFSCGFNGTNLTGNTPVEGTGTWTIVSGTGGQITDPNNPQTYFSGTAGSYTLKWTISNEAGTCQTSDEMMVSFTADCSTLDFDGINDHISIGDNYNLSSGNFTIEAWVKLNSVNGQRTIVSKRDSQNISAGGYDLSINSGAPTFKWGNSTVTSSYKLDTQRWYHVAVIFTNGQAKLYVDGIKVGNGTASNPTSTSSPFLIGAIYRENKPEDPVNYFHGWIEEVRLWQTALEEGQLQFMMNQRLEVDVTPVKGAVLPMIVPGNLAYSNLLGYYQLIGSELVNGYTPDKANNKVDGQLKNIETTQENSAPLPYISKAAGQWRNRDTWQRPDVWDAPNSLGINGQPINWNIAKISHDISSGGKDIYMLGLFSQLGELTMANPNMTLDENNTGQGLTITHYLDLNGSIDLIGESQLVQTEGSILEPTSAGFIERDQQGTASSYNYNYWSSPVIDQGTHNTSYMISKVMLDGTTSSDPKNILFGDGVTFADGKFSTPRKISNYWLWKFRGTADQYSEWQHIGGNGVLKIGEGYTMKGTSGEASIADRQNYVYKGKPNNGTYTLNVGKDQNYLIGNPYPSSIDAKLFILDNIKESGGLNTKNVFTGAVYFWDHFGGKTHILREYVGGYATYNLIGGVKAIAIDDRINNSTNASGSKTPGQYIPVGQGFFINTMVAPAYDGNILVEGGDVIFKNSQRAFKREVVGSSQFLMQETSTTSTKTSKEAEELPKIRIKFRSPKGYHRELLVGVNPNTTNEFDLGYDAPLNEFNAEDMFWMIKSREFVIQGVPNFDKDQVLPIGMMIDEKGPITIGLESWENLPEDKEVYIHDKLNDSIHSIKELAYETTMEPGYVVDRFSLIFFKEKDTVPTNPETEEVIDENEELTLTFHHGNRENEIQILNNEEIPLSNLYLYNIGGKLLENHESLPNLKEVRISINNYPAGVYIVKLKSKDIIITKKIIMKN